RGAFAWTLAGWAREAGPRGLVHVTREEPSLEELAGMARGFAPDLDVVVLPAWDSPPYGRARPSRMVTGLRIAGLARLAQRSGRPVLVLTSAGAILQRVPARSRFASCSPGGGSLWAGQPSLR